MKETFNDSKQLDIRLLECLIRNRFFYEYEKKVIETKTGITGLDTNTVENLMIELLFTVGIVTK